MLSGVSNITNGVDGVLLFIIATGIIIIGIVTFFMIFFAVKYSRKRHPKAVEIKDNTLLEVVWTVVPIGIVLVMFYLGWTNFIFMKNTPKDAMLVKVTGRQWSWLFTYANGKDSDVLELPVDKSVKLAITSSDVIHGFFIPAFRIKQDAVPGAVNDVWFIPDKVGTYEILCTVYCGLGHAHMLSKVKVVSADEFNQWYAALQNKSNKSYMSYSGNTAASRGEVLIKKNGCTACHTTDGSPLVGPSYKDLYGKKEVVIMNGIEEHIDVDDAFIRDKILNPGATDVKGFPPHVMPSFKGRLTDKDIKDITAYIKTFK